jgi:polyisoprenoid-binding protein YceI
MRHILLAAGLMTLAVAGCSQSGTESANTTGEGVPSGVYSIDQSHTYVSFSYLHQGLSYPLLRATSINGEMEFDSDDISKSKVSIAIAADAIRSNVDNFDKELASRKFFNAGKYPYITFSTDRYVASSDTTGILYGYVTIRDVTEPLELAVTLNNALIHPILDVPVIGFSATGSLTRSDFGLDRFVPVVSDTVVFNIEVEFLLGSNDSSSSAAMIARQASAES